MFRKSVGMNLFIIIFCSIVLLVIAMGGISYVISKSVIEDEVADASLQTIIQMNETLDLLYSTYEQLAMQALTDTDLQILLNNYSNTA